MILRSKRSMIHSSDHFIPRIFWVLSLLNRRWLPLPDTPQLHCFIPLARLGLGSWAGQYTPIWPDHEGWLWPGCACTAHPTSCSPGYMCWAYISMKHVVSVAPLSGLWSVMAIHLTHTPWQEWPPVVTCPTNLCIFIWNPPYVFWRNDTNEPSTVTCKAFVKRLRAGARRYSVLLEYNTGMHGACGSPAYVSVGRGGYVRGPA